MSAVAAMVVCTLALRDKGLAAAMRWTATQAAALERAPVGRVAEAPLPPLPSPASSPRSAERWA